MTAAKTKKERQYLTAVTICGGIITLIDYDGNICYYRQRGIQKFNEQQRRILISTGLLNRDWANYKELPGHISISFEDPEIMGKARASYPNPEQIMEDLAKAASKSNKLKGKTAKK
mgnify:CR=1 FL=1